MNDSTICAIATPSGIGGISIIRVSGKGVFEIADKLFKCKVKALDMEDRKMYLGEINAETFKDRCLAVIFKAPNSYTGEDVLEFHLHGGRALTLGVLKEILNAGAVMAQNGEFTKRAFLNGKLSLSSAEGVIDMINADSTAEVSAGYSLLNGELNKIATEVQTEITDMLSFLYVVMDYPEEELDTLDMDSKLDSILKRLTKLKESYRAGKMVKNGINACIVGKPNVGKSSILNRLINYDRAIVTSTAGTTRDTLDVLMEVNGVKINLTDTAGIRDTEEQIEKQGIERSKKAIFESDIVIFVTDGSKKLEDEDKQIIASIDKKLCIQVINKADLGKTIAPTFKNHIEVSALTGDGITELKQMIYELTFKNSLKENEFMITSERHYNALSRAIEKVEKAIETLDGYIDFTITELKEAWDILGEITGTTLNEDIIDNVFAKFCLGK